MRPDIFLATIGRGSNGSNALEVTEDRAAVTAESQDNIINRVNNVSQYGPSWHYVPGIGVAGTAYAEVPGSALGDLAFTRASSKTRTNAAGVVETIGNNVPPHDYRNADGTLSTFPRLNLEPQRTNSIRNSSMVGAVAGSPGTLPTNWGSSPFGLTQTIVGTGTENGLPYIDYRLSGTATFNTRLIFEASTGIAAVNGQTWTESLYIRTISGTAPILRASMVMRNSAGSSVLAILSSDLAVTSTLRRFTYTAQLTEATTAYVVPELVGIIVSGQSYDFTIRIAAPQMELGAYATTWVPTTTAAVTRLADTASKTGVSSLIGQTEGTLFLDFVPTNVTVLNAFGVSNGLTANRMIIYTTSSSLAALVTTAGSNVFITSTPASIGVRYKAALAYKANDFALFVNGNQIATGSSGTAPAASVITFSTGDGTTLFTGTVNQSALFPTRLTNAQLAQLTTL